MVTKDDIGVDFSMKELATATVWAMRKSGIDPLIYLPAISNFTKIDNWIRENIDLVKEGICFLYKK